MPDSLESLDASHNYQRSRLPKLPTDTLKELTVNDTSISELPGSLPRLETLDCSTTPIQRLPALPSCTYLSVASCQHLQQLPEQLPAGLTNLTKEYSTLRLRCGLMHDDGSVLYKGVVPCSFHTLCKTSEMLYFDA